MTRKSFLVAGAAVAAVALVTALTAWWGSGTTRVRAAAPTTSSTRPSTTTSTSTTSTLTTQPDTSTTTAARAQAPGSSAPAATEPATTAVPAPPRHGVAGAVVVVDPGHNEGNYDYPNEINQPVYIGNGTKSCDTTGTATNDGYSEAAFNTDVAARVRDLLTADGASVVLTRGASTPWGPCIDERARIGNDAHADAAISIHADGGPSDGRGFHIIQPAPVAGYNEAIVAPSHDLALALLPAYQSATGLPTSTYAGADGLSTRDDLGGLNLSTVPKVFIETGNMRNADDAALLSDPAFRQRIAAGIVAGIEAFLTSG